MEDDQVFDFKGEMSLLNVLFLHSVDMAAIAQKLQEKQADALQLLQRSPLIIDCKYILGQVEHLDFKKLADLVREAGLVPVGVRHVPESAEILAQESGWALLRSSRNHRPDIQETAEANNEPADIVEEIPTVNAAPLPRLMIIERPVRSGQQIYCPNGDVVVVQQTSAGSELLAGGSVHVYGALRGRVLAGVQGDTSARIFCQHLEAELVAIAGRYRVLDEIEPHLKGKPVMVFLQDEKLQIVPI